MQHITHYLLDRPIDTDPYFDRVETHYDSNGIVELHFYIADDFYKLDMRTPAMKDHVDQRWYYLESARAKHINPIRLHQELSAQNAWWHLYAIKTQLPHIVNMAIDRAYCTIPSSVNHFARHKYMEVPPALNNFRTTDRTEGPVYIYLDDFRVSYDPLGGLVLGQERFDQWWELRHAEEIPSEKLEQIIGPNLTTEQVEEAYALSQFQSRCYPH